MSRRFRRLKTTGLLTAAVLVHVTCASTPPVQEHLASYIVQGSDLVTATDAVASVGGEITHELGIIRAVGAKLTPSQADRLRNIEGIQVHPDSSVKISRVLLTQGVRDFKHPPESLFTEKRLGSSKEVEIPS